MKYIVHMSRFLLLCIVLLLTTANITIATQHQSLPQEEPALVSDETYEKVLDILFPQEELKANFEFGWIIRYRPTYKAESQVLIMQKLDNLEVIEYTSLEGNIRSKLDKILERTEREDADEMAKQIKVERRVVRIPSAQFKKLRERFATSFRILLFPDNVDSRDKPGTGPLYLHGTWYHLKYMGKTGDVTYDTLGPELGSEFPYESSPLVSWMNEVWKEVKIAKVSSTRSK